MSKSCEAISPPQAKLSIAWILLSNSLNIGKSDLKRIACLHHKYNDNNTEEQYSWNPIQSDLFPYYE